MTASTARNAVAPRDESAVYMAPNGELRLEVRVDQENETVWLTQDQMARLFGSSQRMMSYHINGVFSDGELERKSNIQKMYIDRSKKPVSLHSLDVIISVGYRVKSPRGLHFRKWATRVLRERLIRANRERQLQDARLEVLGSLALTVLTTDEARALLAIIGRFSGSWQMLRQYDENQLPHRPITPTKKTRRLTLKQAHEAILALKADLMQKGEASDLFGLERDNGLAAILGNIEQTFDGQASIPASRSAARHCCTL